MYQVLVPIDNDESRARAQVEAVLDLPHASESVHVDVLYVYEEIDAPGDEAGAAYIDELNEQIEDIQGLPETVDHAVGAFRDAGVDTDVHDVRGDPSTAILEVAREYDVDVITVGSRSHSPVGKVLFGSVAQAVILDSDRPVLVAPQ